MLRRLSCRLPWRAGYQRCERRPRYANPPGRAGQHRYESPRQRRNSLTRPRHSRTGRNRHVYPHAGRESQSSPALGRHAPGHTDAHGAASSRDLNPEWGPGEYAGAREYASRAWSHRNANTNPDQNSDRDTLANGAASYLPASDITPADFAAANITAANITATNITPANITSANIASANVAPANIAPSNGATADIHTADGVNRTAANASARDHLSPAGGLITVGRLQSGLMSGNDRLQEDPCPKN